MEGSYEINIDCLYFVKVLDPGNFCLFSDSPSQHGKEEH